MRLRGDCRPIRGSGPGGWRWVGSERLAFFGSQRGQEVNRDSGIRQRNKAEAQPDH
jgi:hypothetical protein